MAFTAQDVKKLREMTNVGMIDCKKALHSLTTWTSQALRKAMELASAMASLGWRKTRNQPLASPAPLPALPALRAGRLKSPTRVLTVDILSPMPLAC